MSDQTTDHPIPRASAADDREVSLERIARAETPAAKLRALDLALERRDISRTEYFTLADAPLAPPVNAIPPREWLGATIADRAREVFGIAPGDPGPALAPVASGGEQRAGRPEHSEMRWRAFLAALPEAQRHISAGCPESIAREASEVAEALVTTFRAGPAPRRCPNCGEQASPLPSLDGWAENHRDDCGRTVP